VNVSELLDGKRVCVCVGSGGVGKTTTAAAIALGAAAAGRRVAVVTIDPARRLADSLGLAELGNEPARVDPALLSAAGLEVTGELWALMLDPKRTFDDVIGRLAPDERTRDEILANPVYKQMSSAVAGSQEYTAMSKLYDLVGETDFDLIVLDTPPSRNALDFIEAPDRLTAFLEGRALQMFLRPTGIAARVLGRGAAVVFGALRRVTGVSLLEDLTVFFTALAGLLDGFRDRAAGVNALLADRRTTFVLVTSPEPEPVEEGLFFLDRLRAARLPFGGLIVNRVHYDEVPPTQTGALAASLSETLGERLAAEVIDNLRDYDVLAARDRDGLAALAEIVDADRTILVPAFDDDVHDIGGLERVRQFLFGGDAERRALLADQMIT